MQELDTPYIDAPHSQQPPPESQGPSGPAHKTPTPEPALMNGTARSRPDVSPFQKPQGRALWSSSLPYGVLIPNNLSGPSILGNPRLGQGRKLH